MQSIGERLRRQRLDRGVDLGTVARETKISQKLLEAIEAEEFDKLPGGVFRKSFVRQYAHALGVDESEIADELDRVAPSDNNLPLPGTVADRLEAEIPALPTVSSMQERRWMITSAGSFAVVMFVMLACAAVYSWWQNSQKARSSFGQQAAIAKPQVIQTPTREVSLTSLSPAPVAVQPQGTTTAVATQSVPNPGGTGANPPPAASQASQGTIAVPPSQPPSAPAAYAPPPEGKFRVDFQAIEQVWVTAAADGKTVFSGTLEPTQGRTLVASSNIRLRIGNAGGLGVNLNGKPIGGIGPRGQVRVVDLTPEGSQVSAPSILAPEGGATTPEPAGAKPVPRVSTIED